MKRVLLIDDDRFYCSHLAEALGNCVDDCCVVTAGNGKEAEKVMESSKIDCIITDLDMPEMNGYDFISRTRKSHREIPILAITGAVTPEKDARLRTLGVPQCIEKQFNTSDMVPLILNALKGNLGEDAAKHDMRMI